LLALKAQELNRVNVVPENSNITITASDIDLFEDGHKEPNLLVNPLGCKPSSLVPRPAAKDSTSTVAVLLDTIHFLRGAGLHPATQAMKAEVKKWLRGLSSEDAIAVYSTDLDFHILRDFIIDDHGPIFADRPSAEVEAGLSVYDKMSLMPSPATTTQFSLGGIVEMELASLEAVANHMSGLPGRKALVWYCADDAMPQLESARHFDWWASAIHILANANIAVYTISCVDPKTKAGEGLAKATGGRFYNGSLQLKKAIEDALKDNRCSYDVTWQRQPNSATPSLRVIEIEPKVKALKLLYPNRYFDRELPLDETYRLKAAEKALIYPLEANGTPLSVATERHEESLKVSVKFNPRQISFAKTEGKRDALLDVIWAWYASDGLRIPAGSRNELKFDIEDTQFDEYIRKDHVFELPLDVPGSAVELRVALRDARSGRVGSKIIPLSR